MAYGETKVYFDGSHYIAIPHTTRPSKKRYKPPEETVEVKDETNVKTKETDTENVEPMVHVMPMTNVLREDVRSQPFKREDLLEGAPEKSEDSWQVPRLVK